MEPCEQLSRIIFEPPTQHYKSGLAFLAWLSGRQPNSMLVNRDDTCRSSEHLARVVRAAAAAGVMTDAQLVADRLESWLRVADC